MHEPELLARSAAERERIFARYALGREKGAPIDPWEDPGFEVYHATDRYGFIHDRRLPRADAGVARRTQLELERQKKWAKMLKAWEAPASRDKLRSRVFKGIPNSLRPQAWCRLLGVDAVRQLHPAAYEAMLRLARQHSTDARQIDSDVNRQFREHLYYRERYSVKQQSLFNVLTAYAMYNSEVGYCQGMSGLAGVLLMYMGEEDAFWAMHVLLTDPKYAMHGLYKEGFPKLTRFLAHHDRILGKFLPKVKKHFDRHGVDAILYSLKWFFVCFIERLPFNLCLRIWDIHLLDGERVITAMAYTILKLHKRYLLKLSDMDAIVHFIQVKLYKDFLYDDDFVIQSLEKSIEELKRAKLDTPGPPQREELPLRPFGVFKPPTFEQIVGARAEKFTDTEAETREAVALASERARDGAEKDSQLSVGGSIGLAGSKFSFDPSMEDGSSLLELDTQRTGSRRSLADTSVTSTADLSVSAGRRSPQPGSLRSASASPPDVLRIFVPASPPDTPLVSPHRVRIRVLDAATAAADDLPTPLVEQGRIRAFGIVE